MTPGDALCSWTAWDAGGDGGSLCEDGTRWSRVLWLLTKRLRSCCATDAGFAA